ncbi:WLM domain-containing protein [Lyophyllum atratum]|nr:WLM domain-containing protein [Lyophyllum atratum]
MTQVFVQVFTHLKDKPKADQAVAMLQRIASLVKPIMRKHNWNLPVLAEFFPESANLLVCGVILGFSGVSLIKLDVNMGQKICLRLRPAHAPDTFYDEEDVVQTMLHELTHNVHGPHDEKFYKFLSGLQDEYDALQRSGYAGEGFFSKGHRVGADVSHDLPPHLARLKALEAAEKRRQSSRVLGSGGRLGGRMNTKGLSPRELAAQAAERRTRDEKACASGALANQEAEKAAKESVEDHIIDLTVDDSDSEEVLMVEPKMPLAGPSKAAAIPLTKRIPAPTSTKLSSISHAAPITGASGSSTRNKVPPKTSPRASTQWPCSICTLLNDSVALQCDACFTVRPPDLSLGWACLACGEVGIPHERWMCQFCGTVKTSS